MLSSGHYLGASSVTAGQPQGTGETMETEGTGHVSPVATVTISAPSATTVQRPAQAEA